MVDKRHYGNAPIETALIDLQVSLAAFTDIALLAAPTPKIRELYPESTPVVSGTAQVSLGPRSSADLTTTQVGYYRKAKSEPLSFQARRDGLTVLRSRPYGNWESLRTQFFEIWEWYKTAVNIEAVKRVGVRYTNKFSIPQPIKDFRDYFKTVPAVGDSIPGGLAMFTMQLQIPIPETGDWVVLSEAMPPLVNGGVTSAVTVILDIDVVRQRDISVKDIGAVLDELHDTENRFFESSITDLARSIIQ